MAAKGKDFDMKMNIQRIEPAMAQIISFSPGRKPEFMLDHDLLASVFAPVSDKRTVVITMGGSSRQGRSFLFNFVLRYLESLGKGDDDFMGWDKPTDALTGFAWGHGEERKTLGAWITTKPIIITTGSAETEVAVYLMDTQGVLDEFSSISQTQFILELCLGVSTTLIFNSAYELHEDKLLGLGTALMSMKTRQCDHIYMVIRDWSQPDLYPLGETGGQMYKERRLQIQDHHSEASRAARRTLQTNVGQIDCFLLPHPGPNARKHDYNGNLTGLSTKFSVALEPFLLSILNESNLAVAVGKNTGTDLISIFKRLISLPTGIELELNQLSLTPKPMSNEDQLKELYQNLADEYMTKLTATMESATNNFLDPTSFEAIHSELKNMACEKYMNCNFQASFASLRKYEGLLIARLEVLYSDIKKVNEDRRTGCLNKWNQAIEQAAGAYREEVQTLFENGKPTKIKERTMKNRISKDTHEYFDTLVDTDNYLYTTYSQNLVERFDEIFMEENAAMEKRMREIRQHQFEACKTAATEQYDSTMAAMIRESGAALCSEEQLKSFHNQTVKKTRAGTPELPDNEGENEASYEDQLLEHLQIKFTDLLAQHNMKRADFMEKKNELLEPAFEAYLTWLNNWKREYDGSVEKLKEGIKLAEEEAKAALKARTLHVPDESIIAQLFIELNDTIKELCERELAELEEKLQKRQKQIEILRTKYTEQMLVGMKELEVPSPEAVITLHGATVENIILEMGNEDSTELKDDLQRALAGEPLAEFQRKAAGQLKARKHEAEHFATSAIAQYETQLKAINLAKCGSTQTFHQKHFEVLNAVIQQFRDENEVSEVAFLQPYIDKINSEAMKYYERQVGLLEVQLEKNQVHVQKQILAATKAYEDRMERHFERTPFMRRDVFRLESDRIIDQLVSQFGSTLMEDGCRALRAALETLYPGFLERNTMNTPSQHIAIGIDLGTTYSCGAVYLNGEVRIIPSEIGGNTVPSYVGFTPQGELVGEAAKNQAHENPTDTIFDAKRLIGRDFNDPVVQADMKLWPFKVVEKPGIAKPAVMAGGVQKDPELISAKVLKHLKKMAQEYLQVPNIEKAVITVPAYFNDGQRQATKDAGFIAGLEVLQIINEPTAAAMAYYLHSQNSVGRGKKYILVYDLGGGTFDVSILKIQNGNLEVKAVNGDTHLGGEDFDQAMVEYCVEKFKASTAVDITALRNSKNETNQVAVARQLRRLRNECEKRKKDLSEAKHTTIAIDEVFGLDLKVKISRADFEEMNRVKFDLTLEIVTKALQDAKLSADQIDEIVLVGGSTRIPKIQQLLQDFFGGRPLYRTLNPDEAVARGAAILAAKLNGDAEQKVLDMNFRDVTSLSIGTELRGGRMSVIVPRNTPIPCKIMKTGYTTAEDFQTIADVIVYEGEDRIAENNHYLGSFLLTNIPSAKAGVETIAETVEITKEGILHVTATLDSTGGSNDIVIKPEKGRLSQQAIADLREMVAAE